MVDPLFSSWYDVVMRTRKEEEVETWECEKCEMLYNTGDTLSTTKGWYDELFCASCYHNMYPCPEWCGWEDCPQWEMNHGSS